MRIELKLAYVRDNPKYFSVQPAGLTYNDKLTKKHHEKKVMDGNQRLLSIVQQECEELFM